jgi:RNA polymerase sigma factor (sigma-70 family)
LPIFKTHPELLPAFREGDRRALETVYRFYVHQIEKYLRSLARSTGTTALRQPSAVADLLQTVFVRAFSDGGRRAYDGLRDYAPYLATIARNCFIDLSRECGREVITSPDELVDIADGSAEDDESPIDPKVAGVVRTYVESLVDPPKGVYEQRFVRGLSQEQTSANLGLSRRAVRTAEKRLRQGLRKALSRAGISLRELDDIMKNSPARIARSAVVLGGVP